MGIHTLYPAPQGPEETFGYLHGGLLIDFVGQMGVGKGRLVVTDCTLLLLQLINLAATRERWALLTFTKHPITRNQGGGGGRRGRRQTVEREEAGLEPRDSSDSSDSSDDDVDDNNDDDDDAESILPRHSISDLPRPQTTDPDTPNSRDPLLSSTTPRDRPQSYASIQRERETAIGGPDGRYAVYSGELVVARLNLLRAVREQWVYGSPGTRIATTTATTSAASNRDEEGDRERDTGAQAEGVVWSVSADGEIEVLGEDGRVHPASGGDDAETGTGERGQTTEGGARGALARLGIGVR